MAARAEEEADEDFSNPLLSLPLEVQEAIDEVSGVY